MATHASVCRDVTGAGLRIAQDSSRLAPQQHCGLIIDLQQPLPYDHGEMLIYLLTRCRRLLTMKLKTVFMMMVVILVMLMVMMVMIILMRAIIDDDDLIEG